MKTRLNTSLTALALLAAVTQPRADDKVDLVCTFQYGLLEVSVNYTRETVNGETAMITDKEIVWTPPGENQSMAIINRYSGIMEISQGRKAYTGMCNRKAGKQP
ncbi:MAG: hypothetical protein PVJ66_05115 [Gammaproteobacteria bacterium]|jgi:hypothetical protein